MDNVIFSANIVAPLLVLMIVGFMARRQNLFDDNAVSQFNSLTFKMFLPLLLFQNVRSSSLDDLGNTNLFVFVSIFAILGFAVSSFIVMGIEKDNSNRGVMVQGIARSNYSLFGIPLITMLFPDENVAVASILIAIVIPIFNIGSVVVLTYFSEKSSDIKNIFMSILKNPLMVATFSGILCLALNIQFPYIIEKSMDNLASIATPLSLFLLGASFEFNSINKYKKQIIISVIGKLIIKPATILAIGVLLGFTGVDLGCIMIVFASPTAVASFTMAKTMGANSDLASAIVVFTSIFCIFTMFLYILVFRNFGLFWLN